MRMVSSLALLGAAVLTGCAASVQSSTPRTVIIADSYPASRGGATAQALADVECAKHKRFAKMIGRPQYGAASEYVFECVE